MPIAPPPAPQGLLDAVLRTAAELLPGRIQSTQQGLAPREGGGEGGTAEPEAGTPRPLYSLGLDRLLDGSGVAAAEQVGWRTMVSLAGTDVAMADSAMDTGEATVQAMNYGPYVGGLERVHRMIGDSEQQDGPGLGGGADLEERVLQVPGVYFVGAWLHDGAEPANDTIVPAAPAPPGLAADQTYRVEDVVRILTGLARQRTERDDHAQEPPPGG